MAHDLNFFNYALLRLLWADGAGAAGAEADPEASGAGELRGPWFGFHDLCANWLRVRASFLRYRSTSFLVSRPALYGNRFTQQDDWFSAHKPPGATLSLHEL